MLLIIMICQIYFIIKKASRRQGKLFYCEKCESYVEICRKCQNMLYSECLDPLKTHVQILLPRLLVLGNEGFGAL